MTETIEQYPIKNRWTGEVIVTAEISVTPDMLPSVKLGLAVRWAVKEKTNLWGANLSGADLLGADLSEADLSGADLLGADLSRVNLSGADLLGADLSWANLLGADLRGANLSGANLSRVNLSGAKNITDTQLRPIIADLWFILSQARPEIPAMVAALREGRVDRSTYSGDCACLVGTLENAGAAGLPHNSGSPAERWFIAICKGDKPGDDSPGGFASAKALAWIEQYCRATGVELEPVT